MSRVYFDYAATSPLDPEVAEAMVRVLRDAKGNASSLHAEGRRTRGLIDRARDEIAAAIGAEPSEIVFTSGGTDADNLALRGVFAAESVTGGLVTTAIEHHAVLDTALDLREAGVPLRVAGVDRQGCVDPVALDAMLEEFPARLVSVMYANNEVGTVQPIAVLGGISHRHGALFHTDAVQAFGALPFDVRELPVDLASVSAHKLGGPMGVGALFVRRGTPLAAAQTGGGQEHGLRGGTENIAGIVGFGVAARLAATRREGRSVQLRELRDRLVVGVSARLPEAVLTGDAMDRLPGHASFCVRGVRGEALVIAFDLEGFAVSSGSACTAGRAEPSHVLRAMGFDDASAGSSLRVTLGGDSTIAEVDAFLEALPAIVGRLRTVPGAAS